ncbi:hypothetical protein [Acetobacter indonesiensis]|uniref:hypothetical protein n=1 Tax=Acetobacter indonesiensis TaxID=104101 RepID=UPI0011776C5E|nr:hypothetical protein [Acetobacter indonesiensis]
MHQTLVELATKARVFIEPLWQEWHVASGIELPKPLSRNTCGRSSLFVVEVLNHAGIAADWKTGVPRYLASGVIIKSFGFFANNRWNSHSWVEAGGHIVDITVDQFGDEAIIVVANTDSRYRIGDCDPAFPNAIASRRRAVELIWPRWLNSLPSQHLS